ncbi:NADH-quinone oxidoreductase subunit C [Streptomyces tritici]|uniref:NADH-quinone oxidoreductase subunit C n=1 Tax=Streptomyces tritici TaxID=2054410 RepID=UPI003AF1A4B8
MSANPELYDGLPETVTEVFGPEATAERAYDLLTVDVPAGSWTEALTIARDTLGCTFFDWLSAVDEPGTGFRVCAHVAALEAGRVRRLLLRTTVPHEAAALPTAVDVYAGAAWHERETHEMFGVTFTGHPHLVPLLLPENFEGHPLRKDFVLAARVAKAWPGAKEPGESEHGGPKRRQMLPPGVPDPNEWGPLKGQLPPAPERPARAARAGAAGDRPVRRARSASEGSASQAAPEAAAGTPEAGAPAARTRRTRSASEGSASQTGAPAAGAPPRRARSASAGSASQRAEAVDAPAPETPAAERPAPSPRPRSSDAPWHHARPAFDAPEPKPGTDPTPTPAEEATPEGTPQATPEAAPEPGPATEPATEATPAPEPSPETAAEPAPEPEPAEEAKPAPDADPTPGTEPAPAAEPAKEPEPAKNPEPAPGAPRPHDPPSAHPPAGGDSA